MDDEIRIERAEEAVAALAEAYRQAAGNRDDLKVQAKALWSRIRALEERVAALEVEEDLDEGGADAPAPGGKLPPPF